MGRPKLNISERQVYELAKIQCTYDEMAAVLDCHPDTLRNRFSDIIAKGRETGKSRLRRVQYRRALAGSDRMLIWLGKQMLGQQDSVDVTSGGVPLTFNIDISGNGTGPPNRISETVAR